MTPAPGPNEQLGAEIGRLVDEKSRAYGDSVSATARILKSLWPDGIPVSAYQNAGLIIRIMDKLKRIATDQDAFGEDPFRDIAGYAMRGAALRSCGSKNE